MKRKEINAINTSVKSIKFQPGNCTLYEVYLFFDDVNNNYCLSWLNKMSGGISITFATDGTLHYKYFIGRTGVRSYADVAALLVLIREETAVDVVLPPGVNEETCSMFGGN